jgi:F0F1-type ATP synthase assembly protein I
MSDQKPPLSYRDPSVERTHEKNVPPSLASQRVDVIGSIVICCVVGALVDRAFASWPWGFLIFTTLGFAIAVVNERRRKK